MPKKTHDEFVKEVEIEGNHEYEVLSIYTGNADKVLLSHNLCGNKYYVVPYSFLNGRRCPKCRSLKKEAHLYNKEFNDTAGEQYELLTGYINARTKVRIKHKICGTEFTTSPNTFLKHQFCPKCNKYERAYNKKRRLDDIKKEIEEVYGGDYFYLAGDYENKNSSLTFVHNICGTTFTKNYHDFINKKAICPKCGNMKLQTLHLKTEKEFEKEFNLVTTKEYIMLSKYVRSNKKIRIKHLICGREWECTPNNYLRGSRCPFCKESKGEKVIRSILVDRKIDFLANINLKIAFIRHHYHLIFTYQN